MLFKSFVSVALFAVATVAQNIQFTSTPTTVAVGSTYQLTWQGGDSTTPVTIVLREGASTNLGTVMTLTTNGLGGTFSWTPDSTLADASDYAFYIVQGSEDNYSQPFSLTGGSNTPNSISSVAAAVSTSSSLASSASAAASSESSSASSSSESSASSSSSASSASASSAAVSSSASSTKTASTTKASSTSSSVPASGASGLQSPVAFILCAVAAMLYFN